MRGTKADRARQSERFLKALRRTGNVSLAAEEAGIGRKAIDKRRRRNPDFAAEWAAALAFAEAHLAAGGATAPGGEANVTRGGEYTVRATRGRTIQVRRAPKGLLTAAGERTFLAHLGSTANVRLSAAATGIGWNAIYARRRRSAQFAREMDAALEEGYERLELALLAHAIESIAPDGTDLAEWREQAGELPEPLTRMSVHDALMLLAYRRPNLAEGRRHTGFPLPRATREEAERALLRQLRRVEKRLARDAGPGGANSSPGGGPLPQGVVEG